MKRTTDIYFAAALMAEGATLEGVDRADPRHMEFSFESEPSWLEDLEREWANGTLVVNAIKYKDSIQRMKSIVHSR